LIDSELAEQLWNWQIHRIYDEAMREQRRALRTRGGRVRVALWIPAAVAGLAVMFWLSKMLGAQGGFLAELAVLIVMVVVMLAASFGLWRSTYAHAIYRSIREYGFDVCPLCGYWLRGLGEDVKHCPECGSAREFLHEGAGASGSSPSAPT
jgi:hypothetical protein